MERCASANLLPSCLLLLLAALAARAQHPGLGGASQLPAAEHVTVLRRPEHIALAAAAAAASSSGAGGHAWVSEAAAQALLSSRRPGKDGAIGQTPVKDGVVGQAAGTDGATGQAPGKDGGIGQATHKLSLRSLGATEYVGRVGVGSVGDDSVSPQETLDVVFDTGSTNIWIASTLCKEGPCVSGERKRYNPHVSTSYARPTAPLILDVKFGTAELKGPLAMDSFHIGPFSIQNQTFAMIQEELGSTFNDLPLEGVIGLGFKTMSMTHALPFFDTVIDQKKMNWNCFAFYLTDARHGEIESDLEGGLMLGVASSEAHVTAMSTASSDAILWGGVDKRLYEGDLAWFPVTQAHYWAIDLKGLLVGNKTVNVTAGGDSLLGSVGGRQSPKLIFDSGTMYYTADGSLYQTLADALPPGLCSSSASYPDITYQLEDVDKKPYNLVISQKDFMVSSDGQSCHLGFMELGVPQQYGPAMILGELFMRKYFTAFDRGDGSEGSARLGFARSKQGADVPDLVQIFGSEKVTEAEPDVHERAEHREEEHADEEDTEEGDDDRDAEPPPADDEDEHRAEEDPEAARHAHGKETGYAETEAETHSETKEEPRSRVRHRGQKSTDVATGRERLAVDASGGLARASTLATGPSGARKSRPGGGEESRPVMRAARHTRDGQ